MVEGTVEGSDEISAETLVEDFDSLFPIDIEGYFDSGPFIVITNRLRFVALVVS